MKKEILALFVSLAFCAGAHAESIAPATGGKGCMNEQATLYVNINFMESDLNNALRKFEESGKTIEQIAAKMGIEKLQMTGENYSLSMNGGYGSPKQFNMSGSRNYTLPTTDKAQQFFTKLIDEGMQANLNVSRNWNQYGGCTSGIAE